MDSSVPDEVAVQLMYRVHMEVIQPIIARLKAGTTESAIIEELAAVEVLFV